jgi:hypothetical protein
MNRKTSHSITSALTAVLCLPVLNGCDTIGAIGGVVAYALPHYTDAAYKGLAGQTVVVMIWVDPKIKMDNPDLQISVAAGLQDKLIDVAKTEKPKALQGTTFPIRAGTVVRYQEDHPEIENELLTTTAAKFDASRLIYVEITEFDTRSQAVELYRGSMKGNLRVLEMKDGTAKQAYAESDIEIQYPKDSPKEGLPVGTDYKIGQGTIDAFTNEVAKRFYRHEDDE